MIGAAELLPTGLLGADGLNRQPLNAQAKAALLAEMPFVSEPVGIDIADLGDATPTGHSRRTQRLILGAGLGAALMYFLARAGVNFGKRKGR